MKKKNLLPTQTAPVKRDNTTSGRIGSEGLIPFHYQDLTYAPFAGDDAE